jgi:uncharacterized membrane protein
MNFEEWINLAGKAIDAAGVGAIVIGTVFAAVNYLIRLRSGPEAAYRNFRQGLGRSILLGLELLVAADIIRTVAIQPTFMSVGVLAIIVAVRTFLSWSLVVELEHRWPWQRPGSSEGIGPAQGAPLPPGSAR